MSRSDIADENESLWQDTAADESCCRVCHGEGELERPLFHPCKCDGSIKFVHQDCLMEWLKVSRQSHPRCELCGEVFSFRRVYKSNAPSQLSIFEFVLGIAQRMQGHIIAVCRAVCMFLVWLMLLPLVTSFVFEQCLALLFHFDKRMAPTNLWKAGYDFIPFWWNGVVVAVLMLSSFFGLAKLCEVAYREIDKAIRAELSLAETTGIDVQVELNARAASEHPSEGDSGEDPAPLIGVNAVNAPENVGAAPHYVAAREQEAAGIVPDAGAVRGVDEVPLPPIHDLPPGINENDVDIWLMPILSHAGYSLLAAGVICVSIALFMLCPVYAGRLFIQSLLVPSWSIDYLHLHAAKFLLPYFSSLNDISVPGAHPTVEGILLRLTLLLEGYVGFFISHVLVGLFVAATVKYRGVSLTSVINRVFPTRQIQATVAQSYIFRFLFIAVVEFALVPQLMGWVIDIITLEACGTTIALRLQLLHKRPLISTLVRQVAGFCFMQHVGVVVSELKALIKPTSRIQKYLPSVSFAFFEDEIEHERRIPMLTLIEKLLIHIIYTLVGIWLFVLLPLKFGHYLFGFSEPLKLKFDELESDMQLPVEMLLFHFLFPFLLQRINQKAVVTWVLRQLLLATGRAFHTYDFLSDNILREEELLLSPLEVARRRLLAYADQLAQHQARMNELLRQCQEAGAQVIPATQTENVVESSAPARIREPNEIGEIIATTPEQIALVEDFRNVMGLVRDSGREIETLMNSIITADPDTLAAGLNTTRDPVYITQNNILNRTHAYACTSLLFITSMVAVHGYMLLSPIYIGRVAMPFLKLNVDNDLYSASVGVTLILVVGFIVTSIARELNQMANFSACIATFNKWFCIIVKVAVLGALWFVVLPVLAGAILSLTIVTPLKTHIAETPIIAWHYFCTGGLIMLKSWMSLVLAGVIGMPTMRRRMNRVMNNGIMHVNFTFVVRKVLYPVVWNLLEFLAVPYVLGRVLGLAAAADYDTRAFIMRYSFVAYMCVVVAHDAVKLMKSSIVKLHNDILDSRYLVGTELANR